MRDTSSQPLVTIIVVSWNNEQLLAECFDTIFSQTYKNHKTILVDNGSVDKSVDFTKKNYPWVDIIEESTNHGFAIANNIGVEYARDNFPEVEYFVFLNTDARLRNDWLEKLILFAGGKPKGAMFQSTTLDYYDHAIVDSTHIFISRNGSGTQAGWRRLHKGETGARKVFGVNAAAAMMSRKFLEAQPFNETFDHKMFMYLEDVDLSARATVMGWDNYLVPGTLAYHMGSASSGKRPGFSLYMTYRNNLALLLKNIPFSLLVRMLPDIIRSDYHTLKHLKKLNQPDAMRKVVKGRVVGVFRIVLFIPEIIAMHRYRKTVSKEYLWQLMKTGS